MRSPDHGWQYQSPKKEHSKLVTATIGLVCVALLGLGSYFVHTPEDSAVSTVVASAPRVAEAQGVSINLIPTSTAIVPTSTNIPCYSVQKGQGILEAAEKANGEKPLRKEDVIRVSSRRRSPREMTVANVQEAAANGSSPIIQPGDCIKIIRNDE